MVRITHKGKRYIIYTDWGEVPLEKFQKYLALERKEKKNLVWMRDVVFCLSDLPEDAKTGIPKEFIQTLFDAYTKDLIAKQPLPGPTSASDSFTYKGIEYKCARSGVFADGEPFPMRHISVEEYMEAEAYLKTSDFGKDISQLNILLAILFRPNGEPFNEDTVHERAEIFKSLPVTLALPAAFFLGNSAQLYIANSRLYLAGKSTPPRPLLIRLKCRIGEFTRWLSKEFNMGFQLPFRKRTKAPMSIYSSSTPS